MHNIGPRVIVANRYSFAVLSTPSRVTNSPRVPGSSSRPLRRQLTWGDGGRPNERTTTPNPVFRHSNTEPQHPSDSNPFLAPTTDSEDEFFTSASHPPSSSPPPPLVRSIVITTSKGTNVPSLPSVQIENVPASGSKCIPDGVHIIAHSELAQRKMDEFGICWGVQYELARGETRGWWKWSDVSLEKLRELRGTNTSSAWKVFSVMKGVSVVPKELKVWYVMFLHTCTAGLLDSTQGGT